MDLNKIFPILITDENEGTRLDVFLSQQFPDVSRSRWRKLIDDGSILKNSNEVLKAAQVLKSGWTLALAKKDNEFSKKQITDVAALSYEGPEVQVVYKDQDILVISKPVGLVVHPGAGVGIEKTLVAWLLQEKLLEEDWAQGLLRVEEEAVEEMRPGIVHRLDRGTSGLMVVARNPVAHEKLSQQFQTRVAGRVYQAVVFGDPRLALDKPSQQLKQALKLAPCTVAVRKIDNEKFSVGSFLDRDPGNRLRFAVSHLKGRKAITHFFVPSHRGGKSLVELKLETGRTHQIRVHLSFLGFPIVGDSLYGGADADRVFLHAKKLYVQHPTTQKLMEFEVPWPKKDEEKLKEWQLLNFSS